MKRKRSMNLKSKIESLKIKIKEENKKIEGHKEKEREYKEGINAMKLRLQECKLK